MMNKACKIAILGVLTGVCSTSVYGQQPGAPWVPIPNPVTMVLRNPSVVRHLALDGRRVLAVDSLVEDVERGLWQLRDDFSDQRNPKAWALIGQLTRGLGSHLSAYQMQRYRQIVWQGQGVLMFIDPEIVTQLHLTLDQRQFIGTVLTSFQTRGSKSLSGQEALAQSAQARAEREILTVLNPAQQLQLRTLLGPPFDFTRVTQRAFKAPEFEAVETWINASPLTMAQCKGQVVVIHFYTYGCINCIRNLPHYNSWYERYAQRGVQIIGIHRPETSGERQIESVRKKGVEAGIQYPVAVDNEAVNWNAWGNRVWPSVYLVDRQGFVRYWWYGELNWQGAPGELQMRNRIEALLKESR
ncbi:MAG: redoxin domain-containing protein [Phycisphaerae bacterium]|nr:redoxin domain-containing protein [Phycisphaerae bacterium]